MSLRRLGRTAKEQLIAAQTVATQQLDLLKEVQRSNRFFALMTDNVDPPTEESLTEEDA